MRPGITDQTSLNSIDAAIGTMVQGVGLERVWNVVPLDEQEEERPKDNHPKKHQKQHTNNNNNNPVNRVCEY